MALYVKIYTDALTDNKLLSASSDAVVLWLRGLLVAKVHLTDGEIRDGAFKIISSGLPNPDRLRAELVDLGLWTDDKSRLGVDPLKWAKYQTTKEQVEAKRDATRERVRKHRQKRAEEEKDKDKTRVQSTELQSNMYTSVTNAVSNGVTNPSLSLEMPIFIDTPEFRVAWSDWERHRREIKKPLKPTQARAQLDNLSKLGVDRAIAMIRHTISMGWQGLREPENDRQKFASGTGSGNGRSAAAERRAAQAAREYD